MRRKEVFTGKRFAAPRLSAVSVVATLAFASAEHAFALPTGEQVAAGQVSVQRADVRSMTVQQGTPSAIVNWQGFSIGASEAVRINQPSAASVILNRVVGANPSEIFGALRANGKVFLVNPSGVLFAPSASVDVGGLVASTLDIANEDFLAGRYRFAGNGGAVTNQGRLHAADRGTIALLGAQVSNTGTIEAKLGTVALAAGNKISLDFAGDGLTNIRIDEAALEARVAAGGVIVADGGRVVMPRIPRRGSRAGRQSNRDRARANPRSA